MKITILEFTPCVDWLVHLRRDEEEGYLTGDEGKVTIKSGAKLRPQVTSIYAGGKATNVARVIETLLRDEDKTEVELVAFLPDSAEGRYLHELQRSALWRVQVRPVTIEGRARLCLDLVDPETPPDARVEFNISPRAVWAETAMETALRFTAHLAGDLLVLAGNPPLLEATGALAVDLYVDVMKAVRDRVGLISLDTEKQTLLNCLQGSAPPDVIKINAGEYAGIDDSHWRLFDGTLVVTDPAGCWVREGEGVPARVPAAEVGSLYSTIGAGDAVHAAFTLARWVRRADVVQAARYSQAAAAAAVSVPDGTRGITGRAVDDFFAHLQHRQEENGGGERR